jgi:predicted MFS family arabinose efflux permease
MVYLPLVLGLATLGLFFWWEARSQRAMLPLSIFQVRNFSVGNMATAAIYGGLGVSTFIIAIFLQQVSGYTALQAGLALLPVTIVMFFLSSRFGALSGRFGPRWFMALGPLTAAGGFLLMLEAEQHVRYWTQLFPGILLFALGLSATVSPLTSAVLGQVDTRHAGVASAVNNAVARIAGLVAVATVGLLVGTQLDTQGFHRVLLSIAGLMLAGSIISAIGIRNHTRQSERTAEAAAAP